MPRAAPRNDPNLIRDGRIHCSYNASWIFFSGFDQFYDITMAFYEAGKHFINNIVRIVHDSLHNLSSPCVQSSAESLSPVHSHYPAAKIVADYIFTIESSASCTQRTRA